MNEKKKLTELSQNLRKMPRRKRTLCGINISEDILCNFAGNVSLATILWTFTVQRHSWWSSWTVLSTTNLKKSQRTKSGQGIWNPWVCWYCVSPTTTFTEIYEVSARQLTRQFIAVILAQYQKTLRGSPLIRQKSKIFATFPPGGRFWRNYGKPYLHCPHLIWFGGTGRR